MIEFRAIIGYHYIMASISQVKPTLGPEISVHHLSEQLKNGKVIALDVREEDEFRYENIPGTSNVPLVRLNAESAKYSKDADIFVLCQTGIRTPLAVNQLRESGFKQVHAVQGGIEAWKSARYPLTRGSGPIPIMRQVQIIAGAMALIGGLFVSLRWVAIFVGAGLIFAGVSGTCTMALILARMPWNKRTSDSATDSKNCGNCS